MPTPDHDELHPSLPADPRFYRRVLDHLPTPVIVIGELGVITYINRAMIALGDWTLDDDIGANVFDYLHPDDAAWVAEAFIGLGITADPEVPLGGPAWAAVNFRIITKQGQIVPLEVTGSAGLFDPVVGGVIYHARPARDSELLGSVLDGVAKGASIDGLLTNVVELTVLPPLDVDGVLIEYSATTPTRVVVSTGRGENDGLTRALIEVAESLSLGATGSGPTRLSIDELCPALRQRVLDAGYLDLFTVEIIGPDSTKVYRLLTGTPVCHDPSNGPLQRIERARELIAIVLLRAHNDRMLGYAARHDALTQLPNRAGLNDEFERLKEANQGGALIFVDLDGFKRVNDQHGHAVGDQVLATVADRLRRAVRPQDLVARLGGDEFVVVLRGKPIECSEVERITRRVLKRIGTPIAVGAFNVEVSASIGVALASDGRGFAQLLDDADRAMYEVKRTGGGNHQIALNPVLVGL